MAAIILDGLTTAKTIREEIKADVADQIQTKGVTTH